MSVVDRHWIAPSPLSSLPGERIDDSLSPVGRENQVEDPALRLAQGGDSSTLLTLPERSRRKQGRRERSRTTKAGGEGKRQVALGINEALASGGMQSPVGSTLWRFVRS